MSSSPESTATGNKLRKCIPANFFEENNKIEEKNKTPFRYLRNRFPVTTSLLNILERNSPGYYSSSLTTSSDVYFRAKQTGYLEKKKVHVT